jgi:GNAT superfamily N-acetyltransferase
VEAIRVAVPADAEAIDGLMKASIRDIFPGFYDGRQTASSIVYVGSVDRQLIDDGTYFVIEERTDLIACGGWSRRDKLYTGAGPGADDTRLLDAATEPARVRAMFVRGDRTRRGLGTRILDTCSESARREGFRMLALLATLPGLRLYEAYGFVRTGDDLVTLPDGVTLRCVAMEMPVPQSAGG